MYREKQQLWESRLNRNYRVLWHQTLGEHLIYYELPKKTYNFDVYPIVSPNIYTQRTASNTGISRFEGNLEDPTIAEVWEADQLSTRAGFYYGLKRFFDNPLNADEYLIWYPKDRSGKAFAIEMISLFVGNVDRMDINPIHDRAILDFGWLKEVVEMQFKILRNYFPPSYSLNVGDI